MRASPLIILLFVCFLSISPLGQSASPKPLGYIIGPDDQLLIQVRDAPEFPEKPLRVDPNGLIYLPMAGAVKAAGRNVEQLHSDIQEKLLPFILAPKVTVNVVESRSQPVSVLGSVTKPGEYQLVDKKSLYQILSLAGGLTIDAGSSVRITRQNQNGRIPLPNAIEDSTGQFTVAAVPVRAILDGSNPQYNIMVEPYDVISVPRADRVYVIGNVQKPGAFLLNDRQSVTVLQALSMAEGLKTTAASQHSKILHHVKGSEDRVEVAINLKKVMEGKDPDVALQPEDILFVPNSPMKQATIRALEAAVQTGTGLAIWR